MRTPPRAHAHTRTRPTLTPTAPFNLLCSRFIHQLGVARPGDSEITPLTNLVLELSRYDLDYDLRDRSRFATALMGLTPAEGASVDRWNS